MERVTDFIFLGSKITEDGDCSHEIKRHLLLGSYDKPRGLIIKQRHHFANKGCMVQTIVFPTGVYRYESWTIKKPKHRRIDALELWC